MKKIFYIFAILLLSSCSSDILSLMELENGEAKEIKEVRAYVNGSNRPLTRAISLGDTVGRKDFVENDIMNFTLIKRTDQPISAFTYTTGIGYQRSSENSWSRTNNDPERIYWSDAISEHTFKGYGCPQGENNPSTGFDWNMRTDGDGILNTYFGSIGDPTATGENVFIDYTNEPLTDADNTVALKDAKYKTGNAKICKDDILLACNTHQTADAGGQVATIKYHHGLCNVRVIVNISGFSASADAADSHSKVTGLVLKNMLTMYKWNQTDTTTMALIEGDQVAMNSIYGEGNVAWNQTKDVKAWIRHPEGKGAGQSKTFTFYALAVPTRDKTQDIVFDVTYPDPMNPTTDEKTVKYKAQIAGIEYRAGYCTTIHISLNHKNDKMTVGAEYLDWEFIETPDQTNLKKNSTMLTSEMLVRANYTIAADQKATKDDATWLYIDSSDNSKVKDIYGNDGTVTHPYIISTAQQLVSFMAEVNSGRNFVHQFVELDADITLQKDIKIPTTTTTDAYGNEITIIDKTKLISWPGIGTDTNKFAGFFLGNNRNINNLYGHPFFNVTDENTLINKVNFSNIVEVQGAGVIANINNGLICGCNVDGNVAQQSAISGPNGASYCGSFVGINNSFIVGCTHKGEVSGYGYVGGIVGGNFGTLIACYHAGQVNGTTIGGCSGFKADNSEVFSCYFNKALIDHTIDTTPGKSAYGLTTAQMQSNSFVNSNTEIHESSGTYIPTLGGEKWKAFAANFDKCYSLNKAMTIYTNWVSELSGTETVETNCRTFTAEQVTFLKAHYNSPHGFTYIPGTYPKIQ